MVKRKLCNTHPISVIPFEVYYDRHWNWADHIRVKDGLISVQSVQDGFESERSLNAIDIRWRSKNAAAFDCEYLLRRGVDVCVHVQDQQRENVFRDARITSIARNRHQEGRCTCLFSVRFFQKEAGSNVRKFATGESELEVTVDRIAILQRPFSEQCRNGKRLWEFSENCVSFQQQSRLFARPFGSEFAWLIVLSIKLEMEFAIRSIQGRIMYIVVDPPDLPGSCGVKEEMVDDLDVLYRRNGKEKRVMTFKTVDGKVELKLEDLVHALVDGDDDDDCKLYAKLDVDDTYSLRRSTRRRTHPDRFADDFIRKEITPKRQTHRETIELDDPTDVELNTTLGSIAKKIRRKTSDQNGGNHAQDDSEVAEVVNRIESDDDCEGLSKKTVRERECKEEPRDDGKKDCNVAEKSSSRRRRPESSKKSARRVFLSSEECYEEIGNRMRDIKTKMNKKPRMVFNVDTSYYTGPIDFQWEKPPEHEEQREYDELWKEMEYALAILPFMKNEDFKNNLQQTGAEISGEEWERSCRHDPRLDEEIGLVCGFCKEVITERRYIMPSFGHSFRKSDGRECRDRRESESFFDVPDAVGTSGITTDSLPHKTKDVWSLIPELMPKLYPHQKVAFEFLWRNIVGSLKPESADLHRNSGGCVISHSPGSGKTLLIVSFLVSYLRAFSGRRPLILAPKTTLCVWMQEFKKWGISAPLYTIHALAAYQKSPRKEAISMNGRRPNTRTRHILDCLDKLHKWHDEPSILLMTYSSFALLAQDNQKGVHRKFMATVLIESPGILVLDEGHNPRSTSSKLRLLLMQVKTRLRVLLSGTLFQNNFTEYFNTLCLARPGFADDVIKKLMPRHLNGGEARKRGRKTADNSEEETARRAFAQWIGGKLESRNESERMKAFEKLTEMTSGFVDIYVGEGDSKGSGGLPGLEVYTVILDSTPAQKEILDKLERLRKPHRYSWELELLTTVASIHPSLINTISGVRNYFDEKELKDAKHLEDNYLYGSKIEFVTNIVHKSTIRGEKVLIFCRNIPPIKMLVATFKKIFAWRAGREILVLQGEQELFDREKTIAKFKSGSGGKAKVLLASTAACSEGISLTAASRVILMDSEWNHSKTKQAIARAFRPGQERVVYVYQLLAAQTLEVDKYNSNERKEWLSRIITTGKYVEHSDSRHAGIVGDDDVLKDVIEMDRMKIFHYSV